MNNWMNYRLRLLKAMGIAPAVMGLALMGCDEAIQADSTPELAMTSPLGPPMALQFTSVLDTGVMLDFDVTGAPPNSTVWLVFGSGLGQGLCPPILGGNCLGITDARLMGRGTSDAAGNVTITAAVPHEIDANLDIHIQAVSLDSSTGNAYLSNIHSDITTTPVRDCGDHPWLDASTAFYFSTLACGPMPSSGVCPDYTIATPRMAERLYQYATGQPSFGALIELTCNETSVEDACCYGMEVDQLIAIGRPFTVDGQVRLACTTEREGWTSTVAPDVDALTGAQRALLTEAWSRTAEGEHASVASFARFALQLMQLGAPADLVAEATRAMGDEISHARDAFAIASGFAGTTLGPTALDTANAVDENQDLAGLLAAAIREGCVAETIAAAQAAAARDLCTDATIRAALDTIAEDESRHAQLAWRFVRWMVQEHPELRAVVASTFAEPVFYPRIEADADANLMRAYGVLPEADMNEVARQVLQQVVHPCAAALLDTSVATTAPIAHA